MAFSFVLSHPAYAEPYYANIHRHTEDVELGVYENTISTTDDIVSIGTNCPANYNLYVTSTEGGSTSLSLSDQSDNIPTSGHAPGSESMLAPNTWGVSTNSLSFAGLQDYDPDTGKLIPLYVGSGNEDYSVYYGVRVPVGKTPGIYSGQVLYTLILDETCLKYTLDFDTNGATSSTLPTGDNRPKVNFGDKVDLSQYSTTDKIAKTGYHLSGWDVRDGEGATLYSNLPIDSNQVIDDGFSSVITLVAQWAINSYRLTITNGNVIAIKSTSPVTGDRDYDAPITATCTPNTGYHCTGWESSNPELLPSSGDSIYNFNMPAGAFTLTANGAANHYAVVYNGGNTGGTCTASPTAATYDQDVTLAHASCVKEHYVQDGWSVSATGSTKDYNVGATVAKANFTAEDGGIYTLYPHFTINAHTINTVGGVIIDGQSSTTTGVFNYNDIITIKADQPTAGYHFTKWTSNGGGTIASDTSEQTTFTVPDNDATLTVSTSPNHYTVAYSAGNTGSTCTATSTPAIYDSNVTLSSTKCTKEGYTQDGWSRTNSATNAKDYDMGQTLEKPNFTAEDGGTYTLYPHFTANQYKLTVKPNGGTWSGKTTDQDFIQDYNSTKFIADPSATPNYIITYDANSQGASYVEQPTSVASNFTGWIKNGTGTWTASNKTWTYGAGDGTLTAGYSATFTLPQITKTGYGCQWAMGSASGPKYDGNTEVSVTTNTTFFAVCTIKSYTLTIVNGNTTAVKSTSPATGDQTYDTAINAVCTPNTGYHCTGWTSSDTSLLPSSSDASYGFNMPAGAITLTAGGAINSFILTYDKNDTGASGSTSSQAVNYNTTVTIRANGFTPATGKHFVKWNTKADGTGTDYNASQTNVAASTLKPDIATVHGGTVTLFAQWAWNHYTVAYSAGNTGSTCTATSTPAIYDSNVTLSSTKCTKEGYTQDGWSRTNSATNAKDYDMGQTLEKPNFTAEDGGTYTLYPHFVINSHTVTINKDSHVGTVSGSGTYEYGAVVTISASNFSSGYKFDEWTVDSGSIIITSPTSATTFFTMPDSDVEITAYATKESYKLTIVNGNSTAIESVSPTTGDRPYDFPIAAICTPNTGYHCTGWESNNPSLLPSSSDATYVFTMPAGAITLTAGGAANNYTVAYNAGDTGATCDISGTSATYDQNVTLTSSVCTKDHYHQDGWSTLSTGDTKDYDLGQTLTKPNFTSENGGTYTLYPHFVINSHTVTVNEGANIIDTTGSGTYDYGTAVSISATPATGYHFSSWTVSSPASGLAIIPDNVTTPAGFVMPDSDAVVTAKGTANNYTIAYGAGVTGGTCNVSSTPATYDQDVTLTSTVCTKDHYHQDGWSTSATGNTKDYNLGQALVRPNFTSENGGTYTLYPHFVINSHNVTVGGADPTPACSSTVHPTTSSACKMPDGKRWIVGNNGNTISWNDMFTGATGVDGHDATLNSGICPTGYSAPSQTTFNNLISAAGSDGTIYSYLGLSSGLSYWSSTERTSGYAYTLTVYSPNAGVYANNKLYPYSVLCYASTSHISSTTGSGTYNYGATVNISATPDTGYHFSDWTVAEGGITTPTTNPAAFTMPDNDFTVNANAAVNSFTLSYSANGGSGTTSSQTVNYGTNVTLRDSSFTPPRGQKFVAWNTSSDGTGTSYSASQSVAAATLKPNISTTTGGTVTLYAIWEDAVKNCSSTNHPTTTESCIMPDGNEWIIGNNGNGITWNNMFTGATGVDGHDATIKSGICPTGYTAPSKTTYDSLISAVGGSIAFQLLGLPSYRTYWSSTERDSSSAYDMDTLTSSVGVYSSSKTTTGYALCYKLTDMAVAIEKGVGIESFSGSGKYNTNDTVTVSATVSEGYHFDKWTVESGGITLPSPTSLANTFTMPDNSVQLKVTAIANNYSINYAAGAAGGSCSITPTQATYDQNVTLSNATCNRTGYTQDGWSRTNSATNAKDYDLGVVLEKPNFTSENGGTYTLYPHYNIKSHNVAINGDAKITSTTGSGTYNYNSAVSIDAATATGYHFSSWTINSPSGLTLVPNSTTTPAGFVMPDSDVSLTANSAANNYTVTYAAGSTGSTCNVSGTPAVYDQNVTLSSTTCTKTGYHQDGWSRTNSASNTKDYDLGATLTKPNFTSANGGTYTLYPHFVINSFTLAYNSNGGSGTTSSQTVNYGTNVTLRTSGFTPPSNKVFKKWNTNSSGTGANYSASQSVAASTLKSDIGTVHGGTVTLYAIWEDDIKDCSASVHPTTSTGCKMPDNKIWILGNSGNTTLWSNAFNTSSGSTYPQEGTVKSGICPTGYSAPSMANFNNLISTVGGDGTLYSYLGLSGTRFYWSSTEFNSDTASHLIVFSSTAFVLNGSKTDAYYVLCYK